MEGFDIINDVLPGLDPAEVTYDEWTLVGMALKAGGYSVSDWDEWSSHDPARYHSGACAKKWNTFRSSGVNIGSLVDLAKRYGWQPTRNIVPGYGWDERISYTSSETLFDPQTVERTEVNAPDAWDPRKDMLTYIKTLFRPGDYINVVNESYVDEDGKLKPVNGATLPYERFITSLTKYEDVTFCIGDYDHKGGAWVCFNPIEQGASRRNDKVTDFRYALVESDDMPIDEQVALYRKLELPIAAMVHSGGKSVHAIVKVDAADAKDYSEKVRTLYEICGNHGIKVDGANKNPSRLSRIPGVMRNGQKQWLIDTNCGKHGWNEWIRFITGSALPSIEKFTDVLRQGLPPLNPELIEGVLRTQQKMIISGRSKAGKSWLMIELACALAGGGKWLGRQCTKGAVLYCNFELAANSCYHRIEAVRNALGYTEEDLDKNLYVWNLRGFAEGIETLYSKVIDEIKTAGIEPACIILDPIYKINNGDENAAGDVGRFMNHIDMISHQLNCAIVFCHHHSKGNQAAKASMDRASGSGVFARDPDAVLDMIQLDPDMVRQMYGPGVSAWQIQMELREFESPPPVNILFDFPVHRVDEALDSIPVEGSFAAGRVKGLDAMHSNRRKVSDESILEVMDGTQSMKLGEVADALGVTEKAIRKVKDRLEYVEIKDGFISKI